MIIEKRSIEMGIIFNTFAFIPIHESQPKDGEMAVFLWGAGRTDPCLVIRKWESHHWDTWLHYCEVEGASIDSLNCFWARLAEIENFINTPITFDFDKTKDKHGQF